MGLAIGRQPSIKFRLVSTLIAVFALVAQPLYGVVSSQIASAAAVPGDVWITTAMPHPASDDPEYVGLLNNSAAPINVNDWLINDGVDHVITAPSTIAPGDSVYLCPAASLDSIVCSPGYSVTGLGLNNDDDTITLKDGSTEIDQVSYTGATLGNEETFASHTAAPTPAATLSSTLPSTAATGSVVDFGATITKEAASSTPDVRVKTTLANPSQAADIDFKYEQGGTYHAMPAFDSGVTYFGPSAGFPLNTATSNFRITFNAAGTYTSTSQIVDATSGDAIGAPVTKTVTVTDVTSPIPTVPSVPGTVIFDTLPQPFVSNLPSQPYQAQKTSALGDEISFAGSARDLSAVQITLSSWACESGTWHTTCDTTPGATYTHPVTLNLYNVNSDGSVGSLVATKEQTFEIPYRPSANPSCADAKQWKDENGDCFNGLNHVVTFNMSGVTVPDSVIYSVAFNTQDYGADPIGSKGPYDTLNVALNGSGNPPSVGTDVNTDEAYWDSTYLGRTPGLSVDTGWTPYKIAARFVAETPDTTAPDVNITNPDNGDVLSYADDAVVDVRGSVTDANPDHYFLHIYGPNFNYAHTYAQDTTLTDEHLYDWNLDGLDSGDYTIDLQAKDAAGNKDSGSSQKIHVTVDNTAPTITVKDGYVGDKNAKIFSDVSFKLYDKYQVDKYKINDHVSNFNNKTTSNANFKNLKNYLNQGSNNTITLYDVAGNTSTYSFTYDNTRPSAHISTPTNNSLQPGDFTIKGEASDDQTSVDHVNVYVTKLKADGSFGGYVVDNDLATYNSTTEKFTYNVSGLASGDYSVKAVAFDQAGNKHFANTVKISVDSKSPTVSITSPTSGVLRVNNSGNKLTISGTAHDDSNFNYYYCYVSVTGHGEVGVRDAKCQTAWAAGTPGKTAFANTAQGTTNDTLGSVDLTGVADGNYTVHVVAKDKAGNTTSATQNFTLDNTAPTISGLNATQNFDGSYTLSATTDDSSNPVTFKLDGASLSGATSGDGFTYTVQTPVLSQASTHTFTASTSDAASNNDSSSDSFTVPTVPSSGGAIRTPGGLSTASISSNPNNGQSIAANGAQNGGDVLGTQTDGTDDSAILGTETDNADNTAAIQATGSGWKIFGLAWYWWLLILAALAAFGWFVASAIRRRRDDAILK